MGASLPASLARLESNFGTSAAQVPSVWHQSSSQRPEGNIWNISISFSSFKKFLCLYFLLCWVFVATLAFLPLGRGGVVFSWGAPSFHCCGFSYCEVWALGSRDFSFGEWWALHCSSTLSSNCKIVVAYRRTYFRACGNILFWEDPCLLHWQGHSLTLRYESPRFQGFLFFSCSYFTFFFFFLNWGRKDWQYCAGLTIQYSITCTAAWFSDTYAPGYSF